jgi:hypothetical protein
MVLNARLGHYTNFVNLLDLAALSAADDAGRCIVRRHHADPSRWQRPLAR